VLCTDKTGTLTVNRMSVVELWSAGLSFRLQGPLAAEKEPHPLAEIGMLACDPHPTDPMEQAFHRLVEGAQPSARLAPVREYGLSRKLLAVGYVWRQPSGQPMSVAAKGAPEAIIDLCGLHGTERDAVLAQVAAMAARGLRVLGIAKAQHQGRLPDSLRGFAFQFCGLAGLEDPVRETVPAAVTECRQAGIRVIMITGDYPTTALAIARQAGIDTSGGVVTGSELSAMSDPQLAERLQTVRVFARVMPEQKLRLVQVLKERGEIVAMTGDGVNDAPALKAAHIGIAMGGRGTDVAREAAGLVLLDDAFESIAAAIRLGRRIFDNLRKALSYILAVHVPIAGLAIVPLLAGWPVIFFPIHVVFLEFVIDPVCSVVFEAEPEERDIMERPPRSPDAPLFGLREVTFGVLQGLVGLGAVLGALGLSLANGAGETEARTIAFLTLVAVNIALVFSNRSWDHPAYQSLSQHNAALWWVLAVMLMILAGAVLVPFGAEIFRFSALRRDQVGLCVGAATIAFLIMELLKLVRYVSRHGWPRPRTG
jgi:P-type Ca2+ transporter type 2C